MDIVKASRRPKTSAILAMGGLMTAALYQHPPSASSPEWIGRCAPLTIFWTT